ncbi:uncharacterized protein PAC_16458 [Phialocephala subalpina]|uniref:Uncharacterized protein n=1 Tax=Phialocephala subalpina TaxID=576137 RepID=A0A1L7XNN5_9HELO|nr:uncharacterized protein PAC_16458 [Phialocephala subalpina]
MATTDSDQTPTEILWRFKESRAQSVSSQRQSQPYCGFGLDAPIIDFYENGYITEFAPLSDVLQQGPERVMSAAFDRTMKQLKEQFPDASPYLGNRGRRRMRWVHIPANNMEWVERVIKCVWRSKKLEKARADTSSKTKTRSEDKKTKDDARDGSDDAVSGEVDDMANVDSDYPLCLRPEYWRDQQRGCIEHCASHPLYARHMVPFFTPVPSSVESATTSKLEPKQEIKTKKSARAGNKSPQNIPTEKSNMVLFMPYIHWATSGNLMTERNTLIRSLAKAFKAKDYHRPDYEEVDKMKIPPKLKMMKAFLFPENDRCLHIRRTLDQFYYSTLPQALADERTIDQVVYRFATKQQQKYREEKARGAKRKTPKTTETESGKTSFDDRNSLKSRTIQVATKEIHEQQEGDEELDEPDWDPPKVMMVNQLWMWVIDGELIPTIDTVVTSFPAKLKSDLDYFKERTEEKPLDGKDASDYTQGDKIYDSTDIWRAVFREFRLNTEYGKRSQKSALDLAWTIADQAAGVFHKRNLHPHLQFIEMFDMEINEIAFKQAEAFNTFTTNVQLAHTANEASIKSCSRLSISRAGKKNSINLESTSEGNWRRLQSGTREAYPEELGYEYHQFAELLENSHSLKVIIDNLDAANADLDTSMAAIDSSIPALDTTDDEIESANAHLDQAKQTLEEAGESLKMRLVKLLNAKEHLEHAISSLDTAKDNLSVDTISVIGDNLDFAQSHIDFAKYELNYDIMPFLELLFTRLEARVEEASTTACLNTDFDAFIQTAKKSLDAYTDMIMDDLFDIRTEASLVREIKDILDELNIIQTIKRQQESVIEPFRVQMFQAVSKNKQRDFYDCTRLGNHVGELRRTAESTYAALRDLLDLKQKEASAIEARSASKDAKASAAQAEASTSLSAETLPLSFFTSLFGMNAKEILAGNFTLGYFSAIMWPISFVVICFSLGLALNIEFRLLTHLTIRNILYYTGMTKLWTMRFFMGGAIEKIMKAVEREKARRATSSAHKKWEAGM